MVLIVRDITRTWQGQNTLMMSVTVSTLATTHGIALESCLGSQWVCLQ